MQIRWRLALWGGFFTGAWAVCRWIGWLMVALGLWFKQRTQEHLIDGIMKTQRFRDQILRPIVVPLFHHRHLMLQHDAQPRVPRTSTWFQKTENIPVLARLEDWPYMSPIKLVWDALDQGGWQRPPVPANIQQFPTASEENQHSTGLNQQPHQCRRNVFRCVRQLVVKPDSQRNSCSSICVQCYFRWA